MFDLDQFIKSKVIMREESMFKKDIDENLEALSRKIKGKSILVIGGAGSIGSSFIKAVLPFGPASLVVADISENSLAELTRDLRASGAAVPDEYAAYPVDYAGPVFAKMFRDRGGFDIVANFSAHKHVRSEKDIYSVEAMLRNNVLNLGRLFSLLQEFPPEEYFCVSTDKAANPVNIMGASKRIMEDVIFSWSGAFPVKTARFANVAFSNGSLPASFMARLKRHQPLSAPRDVLRYFVSPEESGQICMLSCMLGGNREIFFPKLSESQMMSFDVIASELLKAHGYTPLECKSDTEAIMKAGELRDGHQGDTGTFRLGSDYQADVKASSFEHDHQRGTGTSGLGSGHPADVEASSFEHSYQRDTGASGLEHGHTSANTSLYPVYYSLSDTSGEKSYEEFFTQNEHIDMNRFSSLGVITGKDIPNQSRIDDLLARLEAAFSKQATSKEEIVIILSDYLPGFKHIETGKSLDSKM